MRAVDAAKLVLVLIVYALVLFGSAGTTSWPEAWALLAVLAVFFTAAATTLRATNARLLAAMFARSFRAGPQVWDRGLIGFVGLAYGVWFVIMGVDAVRDNLSHMPRWLEAAGAAGLVLALTLAWWTLKHFAAAAARHEQPAADTSPLEPGADSIQPSGPYRRLRHPLYAALILLCPSVPLMLGSWYGLGVCSALAALLVARTFFEDRLLHKQVPGYSRYAAQVRYRLIPLVW